MRKALVLISTLLLSNFCWGAIVCKMNEDKVKIDPDRKQVEISKEGKVRKVRILSRNHHAFGLFGERTYQIEGGYILGLKQRTTGSPKKDLTVFKDGAPVASYQDCTL